MPRIYSVTFFDYTPQPVLCDFFDEAPDWFDEDAEVLAIPDGVSPPLADFRLEAPTIRYMPDGIMWHLYERHVGDPYETATLPWTLIQAAAKQRGPKNGKDHVSNANRLCDRSTKLSVNSSPFGAGMERSKT